jgi:hypothetical protein
MTIGSGLNPIAVVKWAPLGSDGSPAKTYRAPEAVSRLSLNEVFVIHNVGRYEYVGDIYSAQVSGSDESGWTKVSKTK